METRRVLVAAARVAPADGWCGPCGARTPQLTPAEAALLAGTSAREVFRRVEAGQLHFTETEGGGLLICRNSLK